jgi:ABC-type sugar transport system substrate-binding protein
MLKENVTADMLKRTEKAGVKTFTFNTDVPEFDRQTVRAPRQTLTQWIGHLAPDNIAAGKQLAEALIATARQKPDTSPPEILALSGTRDSSAATDRDKGLRGSVEHESATLNQLLYAGWSQPEAEDKTRLLLDRYPGTDVIWCASDGMALGAIRALESKNMRPGVDVMVGGVDWEKRALDAIREGRLTASMGRHFMDGGVALLLIHDFNAGYDFAGEASGPMLSYDLKVANRENLGVIEQVMQPDNWDSLDFTRFSRVYNAELRTNDLSANELMDALMAELNAIGQSKMIAEGSDKKSE